MGPKIEYLPKSECCGAPMRFIDIPEPIKDANGKTVSSFNALLIWCERCGRLLSNDDKKIRINIWGNRMEYKRTLKFDCPKCQDRGVLFDENMIRTGICPCRENKDKYYHETAVGETLLTEVFTL